MTETDLYTVFAATAIMVGVFSLAMALMSGYYRRKMRRQFEATRREMNERYDRAIAEARAAGAKDILEFRSKFTAEVVRPDGSTERVESVE